MRGIPLCCVVLLATQPAHAQAPADAAGPLPILDVPFVSQSELLCGGAAAAMVLRYWGERELAAEAFAHLVDRSAAGIRTGALVADLRRRGWDAREIEGDEAAVRRELAGGRPALLLIEDRPAVFHYVVAVAWHARGVVFHDPARGPFRVMSTGEFMRRWRAAGRWMAMVAPQAGIGDPGSGIRDPGSGVRTTNVESRDPGSPIPDPGFACEQTLAEGVALAQAGNLDQAERVLAEAIHCPGATRELAGVRVLQKRWAEAADLASAAVAADRHDSYAWKVLATSRFVQDDRLGALDAWNAIGEPRIDLVRIDGLARTRHRAVERLLDARPGELLTPRRFTRARRQLAELPAAASTRLDYVPVSSGLAELRGAVAERPVVPRGRMMLAAAALAAAATRELRVSSGALAGGGERIAGGWRFWPHRQRVDAGVRAPAPWGGLWQVEGFSERQPFDAIDLPRAERAGARLALSDWASGRLRWSVAAGIDEWAGHDVRPAVAAGMRWAALDDRFDAATRVQAWPDDAGFATVGVTARARSSVDAGPRRAASASGSLVVVATATVQVATALTPVDLWPAGDTGHARPTMTRAHPLLDAGRLRVDRLGRMLLQASVEGRRWWRVSGPMRAAAAVFTDIGRTARRSSGPALFDVDAGIGARLALDGMPGLLRVDLARGLRDGATAVSVGYDLWDLVLE
jgi:hypothetical protein